MTSKTATFVYVTYINATPEKVFEAIMRPDIARRYWGHENISDWQPGSRWEHVKPNEARTVEVVGKVVECDPPKRMVLTWANESQQNDPSQYSRVTFEVVPYETMVKLTVTHDELDPVSGMFKGVSNGWPAVLSSLKSFLETGQPIDLFGKPKAA